jgi:phosphotransferase system HPr (HPr) family protein
MSTAPLKQIVTVLNPEGLHLRPADLLVRAANQFQASILIGKNAEMVDCKSILSLITLGADQGTQLTIQAEGSDAGEAMQTLTALFANGFAVASDAGESDAGASDAGEPDSCESDAPGSAAVDSANSVPKSNVSASDVGGRSQLGSNVGSGPEPGTAQEQTF